MNIYIQEEDGQSLAHGRNNYPTLILHVCSVIFLCNSVNAVFIFISLVNVSDISALEKTQLILCTLLFTFSGLLLQVFLDYVGFSSKVLLQFISELILHCMDTTSYSFDMGHFFPVSVHFKFIS